MRQLATPWAKELWSALAAHVGGDAVKANRLFRVFNRALPLSYTRSVASAMIAADVVQLDDLLAQRTTSGSIGAELVVSGDGSDTSPFSAQLRVYQIATKVNLTTLLPTVHDFGLSAKSSVATEIVLSGDTQTTCFIDAFDLVVNDAAHAATLKTNGPLISAAFPRILGGSLESDGLHALTFTAGLTWLAVDILRALMRYSRQLPLHLDESRVLELMLSVPTLCGDLYALFDAHHHPRRLAGEDGDDASSSAHARTVAATRARVVEQIAALQTSEEDLVFRTLHELIEACVRTSAYGTAARVSAGRGHVIAFKLDSSKVPLLPEPRPLWEIYVHARNVEGAFVRVCVCVCVLIL